MPVKFDWRHNPQIMAAAIVPYYGENLQDEYKGQIRLDADGTNPAEAIAANLVPVEYGSDRLLVNAIYKREMFGATGMSAQWNGAPVLIKLFNKRARIVDFDPDRIDEFLDSISDTAFMAPPSKIPTEDIYDEAVTKAKIFFTTQADSATAVLSERVSIDPDSGELTSVKVGVGNSVHPTTGDDRNDGYRLFSPWQVSGIGYPLFYQLMQDTVGSADWYAVNPRHTTTTTDPTTGDDRDNGYIALRSTWSNTSNGKLWMIVTDTAGAAAWEHINATGGGSGTVTSVGLSTNASYLTIGSTPVTSSGTITANKTTGLTGNQVVATPDGTTGAADLRALVNGDLPVVSLAKGGASADISGLTTGALIAKGASALGAASLTSHNLIVGNGTGAPNTLAPGTAGNVAYSDGTDWQSGNPASVSSLCLYQNMFSQYASVTVDSTVTTAATTLSSATARGTRTIAANRLAQGTIVNIYVAGRYSRATGSNGDILLKIGSTTLQTLTMFDSTITDGGWVVRATLVCQSTGASGTITWSMDATRNAQARTSTSLPASVTIDTTASQAIDVQCDWTNNISGCTCTAQQFIIDIVG